MNSALYECTVMHRRLSPVRHEFVYRVFLFAIDVDELPTIAAQVPLFGYNESAPYAFFDCDHFQMVPGGSARANAEAYLASQGIAEKPARILLLTNTRTFGYVFNPISIWYCYRADGSPLAAIAEVGNTFGEIKPYLVPVSGKMFASRAIKHFYVSPFSTLDQHFDFRFDQPRETLRIGIDNYEGEERKLISTLSGERVALTTSNLAWFTLKYPAMTLQVITSIHWHALQLWLKKTPFATKEANPELQRDLYRPHGRS
jgi:DUF1365 family protein